MIKEIIKAKQDYKKMRDYTEIEGQRIGKYQLVKMDISNEYAFLNIKTGRLLSARYFSVTMYDQSAECEDVNGENYVFYSTGKRCKLATNIKSKDELI